VISVVRLYGLHHRLFISLWLHDMTRMFCFDLQKMRAVFPWCFNKHFNEQRATSYLTSPITCSFSA